ncbi:Fe2+/Zn2+ uptake regulation protein [Hyella patelloides LEGE 07179]|uniref:Fe2+/Zn2+ uptake regulation protein n=1 Tax=Hyella patelloides LEGE 07179 TaxID=945734 RepID=A0A563VV82_9CYAN|nr:transcriptional repressor [Hyella patelloides]VEP15306.1 Fe2+/Zn2+ uptake regulation protein [Hyella patelloides LEGE 07179]
MKAQRTRSQQKVIQVLQELKKAISAQELYIELRNRKQNMGLATVYRSLEALKLQGELKVRLLPSGESVYSSISRDRHHLTCVNCHTSIPIEQCPVHQLEKQLEASHQFKVYYHTLEFFGLCDRCQVASSK